MLFGLVSQNPQDGPISTVSHPTDSTGSPDDALKVWLKKIGRVLSVWGLKRTVFGSYLSGSLEANWK